RRRHTRSKRDWSSDVCSSDLERLVEPGDGTQGGLDVLRLRIRVFVQCPCRLCGGGRFGRRAPEVLRQRRLLARIDAVGRGVGERSEERRGGKEGRGRWPQWW